MVKLNLTGEKATLLATLYGRALDAASPDSVLRDSLALDAVGRIEHDFRAVGLRPGDEVAIALRARLIDDWTRACLSALPAATVLHLGCGLDTRVHRIAPGPGVRWYDVDYPEVIDLRRQVLPEPDRYVMVGASVTGPDWLADVPVDLPVVVVAEGLVYYLHRSDGVALFRRIVDRFPSGRFVFDAVSRLGLRLQRYGNRAVRRAGATLHWGIDGCADLEAIDRRLRCVAMVSAFELDDHRLSRGFRLMARASRGLPSARRMAAFYRLEF